MPAAKIVPTRLRKVRFSSLCVIEVGMIESDGVGRWVVDFVAHHNVRGISNNGEEFTLCEFLGLDAGGFFGCEVRRCRGMKAERRRLMAEKRTGHGPVPCLRRELQVLSCRFAVGEG